MGCMRSVLAHAASSETTELRLSISAPQTLCVRSALTGEDLGMATLQPEMSMQQIKEAIAEATQVPTYQQRVLFQEQQLAESLESFVKALNEQDEDCDDHARAFRVPRAFGRREVCLTLVKDVTVTNVAGTHLVQYPNCTCTPGPNEACWGYRGTVQEVCPRCQERLTGKQIRTTDGCRRNGDGYGFVYWTCQSCGLVQKHGWDDA
ncbi:unnamed protein product [Durusdinium trenchii]|uniref:Ubiquitin-like domain-containing protein n=1 Tax=Durusdinium trenchii TaxID=1381693 RepID=A0ABP0R1S2_9DINO